MKLKGKKILFMGDSIAYGCGTSNLDYNFANILKRDCELSEIINYSIPGSRIAKQKIPSLERDYDKDFCDRVNIMEDNADAIIVLGGTNDYGHGDAPLGNFLDRTPFSYYGACHTLLSSLIKKYPNAKVIVVTPPHRENDENLKGEGRKPKDVAPLKTYVSILCEVANYYSVPVLDLFEKSGINPNIPELKEKYAPDGVHLNDKGHMIVANMLKNFLKAI